MIGLKQPLLSEQYLSGIIRSNLILELFGEADQSSRIGFENDLIPVGASFNTLELRYPWQPYLGSVQSNGCTWFIKVPKLRISAAKVGALEWNRNFVINPFDMIID